MIIIIFLIELKLQLRLFQFSAYFLLEIDYKILIKQIANILLSLLKSNPSKNSMEIPKSMIITAAENSYLPVVIVDLLYYVDDDLYKLLLKVALQLGMLSPKISN